MAHSSTPGPAQDRTSTEATPTTDETGTPADSALVSRRSLRAERTAQAHAPKRTAAAARVAAPAKPAATKAAATTGSTATAKKPAAKRKGGWAINAAVMTVATGIIATMAIPAFAFNQANAETSAFGPSAADSMKKAQSQTVEVGTTVASAAVARDAASATTEEQLATQKAAAAAEAARQRAAVTLTNYANSYSGPSVTDFLANPPYPNFSLDSVFSVAQQYIGTPYVFGGASPAGFDCSGYVQFVYAQFGVSLPHSVSGQAAAGTRISIEDAKPGDIVIMPGHDGFYAGNGNIMDAPEVGRSISVRPIWTSNFYIVRLGI
ncbi:C40 family peptidase [Leifsonia sp. NPDC058194]|uniref:C40 family peptidase n=1 Tax=Leifsonia sp. NPDC058194 TaxID=3346374 RepID=UPI0036DC9406